MKVAYVTAHVPWGRGETFILDEMLAVKEAEAEFFIIPRNPKKKVFHQEARALLGNAVQLPLISSRMIVIFFLSLLTKPRFWKIICSILQNSRNWRILLKNLAVAPKGVYIASLLKKNGTEHIHAHWGSTTSTMAWIAAELTNIPWSFTLHRWDIAENNLLELKVRRSTFIRCISEDGRYEVLRIVGQKYQDKVKVLHMGVWMPTIVQETRFLQQSDFVIACPANFVPKKGHRHLVEACSLLIAKGYRNFRCLLIGDGPLETEISQQIQKLGMEEVVKTVGRIPHQDLLSLYERKEVDVVVLPSIVTSDGEREGIPVALMEAMAYKIPVISTNTGGIPELLGGGAGLLIPPASPEALALALRQLIENVNLRIKLGEAGYKRVVDEFNITENTAKLLQIIESTKR
jgi:glycosyltransferase involved in cell wall biosynthesis